MKIVENLRIFPMTTQKRKIRKNSTKRVAGKQSKIPLGALSDPPGLQLKHRLGFAADENRAKLPLMHKILSKDEKSNSNYNGTQKIVQKSETSQKMPLIDKIKNFLKL